LEVNRKWLGGQPGSISMNRAPLNLPWHRESNDTIHFLIGHKPGKIYCIKGPGIESNHIVYHLILLQFKNSWHRSIRGIVVDLTVPGTLRLDQVDLPAAAWLPPILCHIIHCSSLNLPSIPEWPAPFDSQRRGESSGTKYLVFGPGKSC
jgi:hypothetical protein